jgi:nitroreductase
MPDALQLLKTRRSPRIPDLQAPGPSAAEIDMLLSIAARVPDHGKLVPWRFLVIEGAQKNRIAAELLPLLRKAHPEATEDQVAKEPERFAHCPLVIAVVSRASPHPKIPEWEQVLSAGAACMSLVLAAHAMGYGANWVTGWVAYERPCLDLLGVGENERIAGLIHIGTPKAAQEERPRPPLSEIVTRI